MSGGRQNAIQGKVFENLLNALHMQYEIDGRASIWQQGTVCRPVVRRRHGKAVTEWKPLKSLPDFAGVIHATGQGVAFDAKTTHSEKYTHRKSDMHQCQHLWRVHQGGGLAFILVSTPRAGYLLRPEPHWQLDKGWSKKLATLEEIPAWPGAMGEIVPDWLQKAIWFPYQ